MLYYVHSCTQNNCLTPCNDPKKLLILVDELFDDVMILDEMFDTYMHLVRILADSIASVQVQ